MDKIDALGRQVEALSPEELAEFRAWFAEFDSRAWDRQFEADVSSGKLDLLAQRALEAHAGGRTTKL